jgi:hypothetical protein
MSRSSFSIGLVFGILLGAVITYGYYAHEITDYNRIVETLDETETKYDSISTTLNQLQDNHSDLVNDYFSLNSEYNILLSDCSAFERDKIQLEYDLEHAETNWESLSSCVLDLREEQQSFTSIEDSFSRIINTQELNKIADKIEEVSKKEEYNWDGYWNIHKYVRDEIQYAYDPEIPVIGPYHYYGDEDNPMISEFEITTKQDLLQSLSYTIEYGQGDCEDQAMLEYAMIQYYRKYIHGTQYRLYLAQLSFQNGDNHIAVFMPVQEGRICILDPAGQYQTGTWYSIESKKAGPELYEYEEHWEPECGEINEIILWRIDIDTGEHFEEFKGSLSDAVVFLSE